VRSCHPINNGCLDILRKLGGDTSVEGVAQCSQKDGLWKDLKNWRSKWKDELGQASSRVTGSGRRAIWCRSKIEVDVGGGP